MPSLETPTCDFGWKAANFNLLGTDGKRYDLESVKGKNGLLIMFICNHCKYVKHINSKLVETAIKFQKQGLQFIGISANDVENFPEDSPENMIETGNKVGYTFPYLYDESQDVAKAFDAACTPDFFLFNGDLALAYTGQLDDSRPGNGIPVTGNDLRTAMNALVNNKPVNLNQKPSMGCNIKWK